ncbi:MAG: hypothetical protein NC343_02515 [Muribaculum sp.]|nr:hypothetical protein [Muribaculaceae bacterium]MCM1080599.1 hypothetical protein [Muribaculum sp.]
MTDFNEHIIQQLIGKFYNGETNLEEEAMLYQYFSSPEVSSNLRSFKDIFTALSVFSPSDFDMPKHSVPSKRKQRYRKLIYIASSIAATIAIVFMLITFKTGSSHLPDSENYVMINNHIVTDKKIVEEKIVEAYIIADIIEREADAILTIDETEADIINKVSDTRLRNELKELLELK